MRRRGNHRNKQLSKNNTMIIVAVVFLISVFSVAYAAFQTTVSVNVKGNTKYKYLYDWVAKQVKSETIDFSQISSDSNGKGVYLFPGTSNDTYPVYYYRGEVYNNNLILNGVCFKIVRTTSTGGTKIVYAGEASNGVCDNHYAAMGIGRTKYNANGTNGDVKWVGYMYTTTDTDDTSSTAKLAIDNFYESKLSGYSSYFEDTQWCNDRSILSTDSDGTIFSAYTRVTQTYQPILTCQNPADNFTVSPSNGNGKLTYPIAMLTADEIMMLGVPGSKLNVMNYYHGNVSECDQGFASWTLSPYRTYQGLDYMLWYGGCSDLVIRTRYSGEAVSGSNWGIVNRGVRPAVSLTHNVRITEGDGTSSHPYQVTLVE